MDDYARLAEDIAREAGAILRSRIDHPHEVTFKGTIDMVTEADWSAEELIVNRLRGACPDHVLLCEEGSRGPVSASVFRWIVDPLDGTTNFVHGLPTFAVSIALEENGAPIIGVVYDPMRNELFLAQRGNGARLNGKAMSVSKTDTLIASILATGFFYDLVRRESQAEIWRDFLTRVQGISQTGSSALNLCYVAAGRLDGYWERGIAPWDIAAGALLVVEAGGTITDLNGGPFMADNREILASNGALHTRWHEVIARHPDVPMVQSNPGA
ncbi:MAG: inositol monophosphatase [Chloroflexia bacterium]|nr:inositol monophosphatase [Chloroflexia bacterium]